MHTQKTSILIALALVLGFTAPGCKKQQSDDPRLELVLSKLDAIDKRLAMIERRGGVAAAGAQPQQRPRPDANTVYFLPVGEHDAVIGAADAKVTIVEAYEFACPHCYTASQVMEQVVAKYPNDVRVVMKSYVVHPPIATLPALAACAAARQGKYHVFAKALWSRAWPEGAGLKKEALVADALKALAAEVGLDVAGFERDMSGDACKQELEAGQRQLAAVGVSGTPMIFVNGRPWQGQRSVEALAPMIEQEIAKANAAIQSGVKVADYYPSLMKGAKRSL